MLIAHIEIQEKYLSSVWNLWQIIPICIITKTNAMKAFLLILISLSFITFQSVAQITMESVDWEIPEISEKGRLPYFKAGPLMIVKIDSIEIELDSITKNNIEADWIKSIHVYKQDNMIEKYGYKAKNGVIFIRLFDDRNEDFLKCKKADNPIKIKTLN